MPKALHEVATKLSPLEVGLRLENAPGFMLLHSAAAGGEEARYSIAVAEPLRVLIASGDHWSLLESGKVAAQGVDVWQQLARLIRPTLGSRVPGPAFPAGGWFGFLGYELGLMLEDRLSALRRNEVPACPDVWMGFFPSSLVWDHRDCRVFIATLPDLSLDQQENELERWKQRLCPPAPAIKTAIPPTAVACRSSMSPEGFCDAVASAQRYIRAGDIYQVNLSRRFEVPTELSGWSLYQSMVGYSGSSMSAFLNGETFQLASISPELFLRMRADEVVTKPIKGTRPRGETPTGDLALRAELEASPKERAELLMITDLLRNDLGKVCRFGSVQVPSLAEAQQHPFVQHLVATIQGEIAEGKGHFDVLQACFPGGSITGAPKVRAMELIHQLEPVDRGPFTGCLGYFGGNGVSQFSILIRTALITPPCTRYWAGAGIVADSVASLELEETLHKSAAFLKAIHASVLK